MALSSLYITAVDLEGYFVDKNTGLPLAGGKIEFWVDGARTTPKVVYQLSGDPTNSQGGGYSYDALPNPLTLSDVGTLQDNNGNNIAIYYYPYDANKNLQLYYIVVKDANGVVQLTREAWPNVTLATAGNTANVETDNQISNPQFGMVNFDPTVGRTISFAGVNVSRYTIAPGWDLILDYSGTGSVNIARVSLPGSGNIPSNPPYWLVITPGANLNSIKLSQRFDNPASWAQTSNGGDGWVATGLALAANSAADMYYVPSTGTTRLLLQANNGTLVANYFNAVVQLAESNNPSTPDTGYVDIQLVLPTGVATTLSSIQLLSTNADIGNAPFIQDSLERQLDHLFHAYSDGLIAKPISSFLVGWDFPLNPTQFGGPGAPTLVAVNNASAYVWDQTIVYCSGNNAVRYSRAPSGALRLTGVITSNVAIIQYVGSERAREILNKTSSVMVSATTSAAAGISSTVSMFWTAGTAVPVLPQSIIASLDINGNPVTVNNPTAGTWTRLFPSTGLGGAFKLITATATSFNNYASNDWSLGIGAGATTGNFLAVVIGFGQLPAGETIDINSVALVPGVIATIPAPQTLNEVLMDCQRYYWKTYQPTTAPGANTLLGAFDLRGNRGDVGGQTYYYGGSFSVRYPQTMRLNPNLTFYSDQGNINSIITYAVYNGGQDSITYATTGGTVRWTFAITPSNVQASYIPTVANPPTTVGNFADVSMVFQLVADARFGIV